MSDDKAKKLFVVRHGQTLFNQKGLIQGWCDSPVTELGHKQAKATKSYLEGRKIDFDHAYCSTLGRTEETLKDITNLPYERLEGLKEFHYGTMEGEQISKASPVRDLETYYVQYGGESKSQVENRMYDTLSKLMENPDNQNVLVVAHGACSYRFANKVDPKKAKELRKFSNCMIYEYEYKDGKFHLVDIIDEHVKDLQGHPKTDPAAVMK